MTLPSDFGSSEHILACGPCSQIYLHLNASHSLYESLELVLSREHKVLDCVIQVQDPYEVSFLLSALDTVSTVSVGYLSRLGNQNTLSPTDEYVDEDSNPQCSALIQVSEEPAREPATLSCELATLN